MAEIKLRACPYCGASAESDVEQGYRRLRDGGLGRAVAIYCTRCDAHMQRCCEDTPDSTVDEILAGLAEAWNLRAGDPAEPEKCIACEIAFQLGDRCYLDADGGTIHADCAGPEREAYFGKGGEPLKDGEPLPTPWLWPGFRIGFSAEAIDKASEAACTEALGETLAPWSQQSASVKKMWGRVVGAVLEALKL